MKSASSSSAPTIFSPSRSAPAHSRRGLKQCSAGVADFHSRVLRGHLRIAWGRAAAELREETGLAPERLYNLSRTEAFYQHGTDELAMIPVFAAFVSPDVTVRLSDEHDRAEWLTAQTAASRFAWPRERRALDDILSIVGGGDAGLLEDVLRVS